MKVIDTSKLIDSWKLYINAKTKLRTSLTDEYMMLFSVYSGPKFMPKFSKSISFLTLNVGEFNYSSSAYFTYNIPSYYDNNPNDRVTLNVTGLNETWMTYEPSSERIYFEKINMDKMGIYKIYLAVTDDDPEKPQTNN